MIDLEPLYELCRFTTGQSIQADSETQGVTDSDMVRYGRWLQEQSHIRSYVIHDTPRKATVVVETNEMAWLVRDRAPEGTNVTVKFVGAHGDSVS